jgi:hypothetical protein
MPLLDLCQLANKLLPSVADKFVQEVVRRGSLPRLPSRLEPFTLGVELRKNLGGK